MSLRTRSVFLFICLVGLLAVYVSAVGAQSSAPFRVYMTFEDGPTQAYTPLILETLAQYNAKAAFLIGGYQIAGNEALLQPLSDGRTAGYRFSMRGKRVGSPTS